ncbi:hypothetical protein BDZ89DRAFT_798102 [Hymenopellis radicata]|nr:hypothetical protein BDZ89DRAFT_798102 [Hymenopellis radicata]
MNPNLDGAVELGHVKRRIQAVSNPFERNDFPASAWTHRDNCRVRRRGASQTTRRRRRRRGYSGHFRRACARGYSLYRSTRPWLCCFIKCTYRASPVCRYEAVHERASGRCQPPTLINGYLYTPLSSGATHPFFERQLKRSGSPSSNLYCNF